MRKAMLYAGDGRKRAEATSPAEFISTPLANIIHKEHQGRREHKEIKEIVFNELSGRSRVTANQAPTDSPLKLMCFQCLSAFAIFVRQSRDVARWGRSGLSVSSPFGIRCLTSQTVLRFHIPLIEPDVRISHIRLSDKASRVRPREAVRPRLGADEPQGLTQELVRVA